MLHPLLLNDAEAGVTPLILVDSASLAASLGRLPRPVRDYVAAVGFEAKPGSVALAPARGGGLIALAGFDPAGSDGFALGRLPALLPPGDYRLQGSLPKRVALRLATLGWLLAQYRYAELKAAGIRPRRLVVPRGVDAADISRIAFAVERGRDLINRPANLLGPAELAEAARTLAQTHGASIVETVGEDLLERGFPMVHAVGRASSRPPRLIDLTWGDPAHPKVTLVGKGVCFDTGGLDIKPSSAMLLMKKDMGGAATALAAAEILMAARAPVRLRVLIPAVENAISGSAFRPGDVLSSRKGLSVEIGNTDAEGRLILADALAYACEEKPDLLLDFATLTGAARVALGPDLPPVYTDDEGLAAEIAAAASRSFDPVWRMPLWPAYDSMLDSKVADLNHVSSGGFAGSITAALFLRRFVEPGTSWAHFDVYGWNPAGKPGRPEGGEVQAARLVADLVTARYG